MPQLSKKQTMPSRVQDTELPSILQRAEEEDLGRPSKKGYIAYFKKYYEWFKMGFFSLISLFLFLVLFIISLPLLNRISLKNFYRGS